MPKSRECKFRELGVGDWFIACGDICQKDSAYCAVRFSDGVVITTLDYSTVEIIESVELIYD